MRAVVFALLICVPLFPALGQASQTAGAPASGASDSARPQATAAAQPAAAAQPSRVAPDLSLPRDARDKWVVAFTVFDSSGLSPQNAYLAYSVPLLLKDQVSGLQSHTFEAGGIALLRAAAISREHDLAEQAVTRFRSERDEIIFSDPQTADAARSSADGKLAAALARVSFLRTLDPSRIAVTKEKPIVFKEGGGAGKLYEPPEVTADVFCAREDLDMLIGGSIKEVQGYLRLDLWAYDAARRQPVFSYREAAPRDEIYSYLPEIGRQLVEVLLGRQWAALVFLPDPPESSLFIDGELAATGRSATLYLASGTREARVSAPGYRDALRTLTLAAGAENTFAVALEREPAGSIDISSDPRGADLYVGSVWKGRTPLTLSLPPARNRAVLSLSGFYDQAFSLSPDSPPAASFTMESSLIPRETLRTQARESFYSAFALFAFSLPVPLFSYSFASDFGTKVNLLLRQGNTADALTAQILGNLVYYGGYIGGTVASASLFAWMVVQIVRYVTASDRTAG